MGPAVWLLWLVWCWRVGEKALSNSSAAGTGGLWIVAVAAYRIPKGTLPPSEAHTDPRLPVGQAFGCWLELRLSSGCHSIYSGFGGAMRECLLCS